MVIRRVISGSEQMLLGRRTVLKSIGLATFAAPLAHRAFADPVVFAPTPGTQRTFEVVTKVSIANPKGPTRVWTPVPSRDVGTWFKAKGVKITGNAAQAAVKTDSRSGAKYVEAAWSGEAPLLLEVACVCSMTDRAVDLERPGAARPLAAAERAAYLRPHKLIPLDGIVKATSDSIVGGRSSDVEKVSAIYQWVVDNTYRDPLTRGCGQGDVAAMLTAGGAMGGKCADINALFVGLVRAAGIPARDIYGLRVGPSRFGYKSLGPTAANVTKAQHCRSEVYLSGYGWVPIDPADVRKVALEEPPGHLDMTSDKVVAARKTLFGAWEGNWVAYNMAQDVQLSGSRGDAIPFLMYPQAEVAGERLDSLNPDAFGYTITSREIVS